MSPARFRWGILFILVGVLLLLNNMGELDWWVWSDILSLWPLILIAIGLEKIFTRSKIEFVAYFPILALAAVVLWVAFEGFDDGDDLLKRSGDGYRYTIEKKPDIENVRARFEAGDIDIYLRSIGTELFQVRTEGTGYVPMVDFGEYNGTAEIDLRAEPRKLPDWIRIDHWRRSGDWNLYFNEKLPLDLECLGDESDMMLDFRYLLLDNLIVKSDDGYIRLKFGDLRDLVKVTLRGEDASFRLSLPSEGGLKVTGAGEDLAGFLADEGLAKQDDYFTIPGYDTLKPQFEIYLDSEIERLSLDYRR